MILISDILSRVTEKDIMEHYYNERIIDKKPIYRNLMRNDTKGTCYFNWYNGTYYLIDRARGMNANFDCYDLVKYLYNCDYATCLRHINFDLGLGLEDKEISSNPGRKTKRKKYKKVYYKKKINYQIRARKWNRYDVQYWEQFGITIDTLIKYNVVPVKSYKDDVGASFKFKIRYKYTESDPCYAFVFDGKKSIRVKLYRPFSSDNKWKSNTSVGDIFGLKNLNDITDHTAPLYIVSGLKDLMCMSEMGFYAIAPQSESTTIDINIIRNLRKNFKKIIILYDNDDTGVRMSLEHSNLYSSAYKILPKMNGLKDIAEFVQYYNKDYTKDLINQLNIH